MRERLTREKLTILMLLSVAAMPAAAQDRAQPAIRFAAMDVDRDGVITRKEWRGSAQSFAVHDWNADGVLSGDEVRVGAQRSSNPREPDAFDSDQREYQFTDWTARGFTTLDHDRNGRVTRDEWHFDLETFRRADHNGDGWISRAEFLGADAPPPDLFTSVDVNRDNVITRDEWHWSLQSFDGRDANRDGRLTRSEFGEAAPEPQSGAYRQGQERGLVEGRQAGREDKQHGVGWDLEGQRELEQADSGYQPATGSRADYQAGYREGFRRGYREGFGTS